MITGLIAIFFGILCGSLMVFLYTYHKNQIVALNQLYQDVDLCQQNRSSESQQAQQISQQLNQYKQAEYDKQLIQQQYKAPDNQSCYGTGNQQCQSCADVINSFKKAKRGFDLKDIDQCNVDNSFLSQYCGDQSTNICRSCTEVLIRAKEITGKDFRDIDISQAPQCQEPQLIFKKK